MSPKYWKYRLPDDRPRMSGWDIAFNIAFPICLIVGVYFALLFWGD